MWLLELQLESYYKQQVEMATAMSQLHSYYSQMMDCLFDHIDHQLNFGWRFDNVDRDVNSGQMAVILLSNGDADSVLDSVVIGGE